MTTRPASPPRHRAGDLDAALDALRADGLRITAQRTAIVEILLSSDELLTADRLLQEATARLGTVAPSTVYRVLAVLEEAGIVTHVHRGHGPAGYTVGAPDATAVCDRCGAVVAIPAKAFDALVRAVRAREGFVLGAQHFALSGMCARCKREDAARG